MVAEIWASVMLSFVDSMILNLKTTTDLTAKLSKSN